jgi:hypothetical protein
MDKPQVYRLAAAAPPPSSIQYSDAERTGAADRLGHDWQRPEALLAFAATAGLDERHRGRGQQSALGL